MKKKHLSPTLGDEKSITKILKIMKISLLFLIAGIFQATATTYSQTEKISLSLKNQSMEELITLIEQSTKLKFLYRDETLSKQSITITAENEPVESLLTRAFNNTDLTFKVMGDKLIVITSKEFLQQQKITGTVNDASTGEPIIGANVVVEGSTIGVVTDVNGRFTLELSNPNSVLLVSFIGYNSERIVTNGLTSLEVRLVPDITKLEEVVVVGYGTQKKRDMIGSVSSISSDKINQIPVASLDGGLQGKSSGLHVLSSGGTPGAPSRVLVRGTNTLSLGTEPLYVVDGMPISTQTLGISNVGSTNLSPLTTINPNDIESIEVLKDASATSIYGSRASNGVILITTKSGKSGKGSVEVSYSSGISDLSRKPDDIGFTTSKQYFQIMDQARANSGMTPMLPSSVINTWLRKNPSDSLSRAQAENADYNWYDQIMRKGSYQDVNVSLGKGEEKSKIFASLNYRKDNGVLKNNSLERFSGRINSEFNPLSNLIAGFKVSFAYTSNNRMKDNGAGSTSGSNGNGGGFAQLNQNIMPWFLIYSNNDLTGYWNAQAGFNPAASMDPKLVRDESKVYRGLGGVYLQYNIPWLKGLSLRTEFSADIIQSNSWNTISKFLRDDLKSYAQENSQTVNNVNYNIYGNYNRTFGKHTIGITGGAESQSYFVNQKYMEAKETIGSYQQIGDNPLTKLNMGSTIGNERYIRSYFGRVNYKFANRYLMEFSLRSDASSVFPKGYQWANFKAVGLGWIVSDEKFWNFNAISLLKIRGSFGQTGNQNIPADQYQTRWSNIGYYGPTSTPTGSGLGGVATALRWELTNNYDAGLDFGLFDNKISGSIAYFLHDIEDLLILANIPASSGISTGNMWQNIGKMRNSGIEMEINATPVIKGDFKWSTSLNITFNSNKILALTDYLDRTNKGLLTARTLTKKNGKIGAYFLAEYAGVDKERGVEMIYEIDRNLYLATGKTVKTGTLIPATTENMRDHKILHEEKTGLPIFWGGFTNSFSYKGLDLNIFFAFQGGNYIFDMSEKITTTPQRGQYRLRSDLVGNTWTKSGDNAKYPKLVWDQNYPYNMNAGTNYEWRNDPTSYNNESDYHDKYLHKGDFVRLKTLQLGYSFPAKLANKAGIQNIRIYVSGTNLFTLTRFKGYDPEVVSLGSSLDPGLVGFTVPNLKIYSLGVNLKF